MNSTQIVPAHKFPLRITLVVPFVLQIVAAVGLVGYLSLRNGQRAVDDLANQLNGEISARIEQHVVSYLNKSQNALWLTYTGVQSGNLDLQDFEGLRRYFWQIVHKGNFESYLSYGNKQGEFVGVEYQDDGTVQLKIRTSATDPLRETYLLDRQGERKTRLKTAKYDPRTRPWYKAAKQAGKPTWSKIYPFFSSKNTVLGISPVYPFYQTQNKLLGVLCINVRLTQITDFINHLYISPNGQSFIMERSGELVASSKIPQPFKVIGKGDDREIERMSATQSDHPVVQATAQHLQQHFGQFQAIQESRSLKFQANGAWYYAQVRPIQDGRGIDWLAVVVVPEQDFMTQINQNTRNTIFLCLAALGTAIAIGILTSRWVTRPILRVSQASNELAQGELHQQVEPSPITEINTLADSFNGMAGQLKKSFDALRQSEAHNQALLNAIPDLMVEVSDKGVYLDAIAAKDGTWLMMDREDWVGQSVQAMLPTAVAHQYRQAIEHVLQGGKTLTLEYEFQVGDEMQTFEARVAACRENSALFLIRNISDRKQAEAALRQSEATNRALIDAIPDLLLRVNRDGTYLDDAVGANRLKAFSGGTTSLAQTTVQGSLPPQQAQQRMAAIEQALKTGTLQVYEQRLVINGKPIDEEVRIVVTGEDEALVIVRDISDRKQAEESLRIAEETYRSIFENALEGIFQSSPEGQFINLNSAMARIYGYSSPQDMIDTITNIITQIYVDPEDQIEFQRQMEVHDQVKDFEYRVYQKDSTIIWIQEDTRAVRDNTGQLLYYEGMIQDVTDRKRLEEELRRQLAELKIEIDQKKREKDVAMLTESSYFQEVQQEMAEVNLDEFWS